MISLSISAPGGVILCLSFDLLALTCMNDIHEHVIPLCSASLGRI